MSKQPTITWKYLAPKPGSAYQQLFVIGGRISARVLYGYHVPGEDYPGQSVEELAEEFNLPVEAVREAIAYCESDPPEIRADHAMDDTLMDARGENDKYRKSSRILSPQERNEIIKRFRLCT